MADTDTKKSSDQVELVKAAAKGPLGFLTVGVLVIEAILGGLAVKATGQDVTNLIYGMLGVFILLFVGFFVLAIVRPQLLTPVKDEAPASVVAPPIHYDYDVFVSAPMAAARTDEEYEAFRAEAMAIVTHLRTDCGFGRVYYAGENIPTPGDFDSQGLAIKDDYQRLKLSRYFLLIFLHPVLSSTLVEAGIALQIGIPSAYLVKSSKDLPFLLRNATEAFPFVHIHECEDLHRIRAILSHGREHIFMG